VNALLSPSLGSAFSGVTAYPGRRSRYVVSGQRPNSWEDKVKKRLDALCSLASGWDGYNGRCVSFSVASFALNLLESIMLDDYPLPSLVPLPSGGLQIEWHLLSGDIELVINAPYDVEGSYSEVNSPGNDEEVQFRADYTLVATWLSKLGDLRSAMLATAA
jgi:hypothetical protein